MNYSYYFAEFDDDDEVNRRFKNVRANYFCASLLAYYKLMKITNDRVAGHCYSFAWTKLSSVIPVLLSIDHFLYGLSKFGAKKEENLSIRSLIFFFENATSNSAFFFSSSFHCAVVSNASGRVTFYENIDNVWNY